MKKIIKSLLFMMFTFSMMFFNQIDANAETSGTTTDGYTYTVDETTNEATLTGYTGGETDITIPSVVDGHTVIKIGLDTFRSNKSIISVIIPGTIKTIGKCAFWYATNLKEITILDGCKEILSSAFLSCTSLEKLEIPASVTTLEYIDSKNEIFDGVNAKILKVYIEPESAAQTYFDTYEDDIQYYYMEEYCPSSVEFKNTARTLNVEDTYTFSQDDFTVSPDTAYVTMPTEFTTSDFDIAYIDSNGMIHARKEGIVTITATITDDHLANDIKTTTSLTLTVEESRKAVESVRLNVDDVIEMNIGDTIQLEPTVSPSDATYTSSWGTTNSDVASISETGLITALAAGSAQVGYDTSSVFGNVYDNNGKYILIVVNKVPVQEAESVTLNVENRATMYVGDTLQLEATVLPSDAVYTGGWHLNSFGAVGVASISETGLVTATGAGYVNVEYDTFTEGLSGASAVLNLYIQEKTTPSSPTDPTDPATPATPTNPATPATPATPTNPPIPSTPSDPTTPEIPTTQEGKITLNSSKISLQKGKKIKTLELKVNQQEGDTIASVTSSNTKVLKASLSGQTIELKGLKKYSKYVTVTVTMKSGATATCKVKVVSSTVTTKKLTISDKKLSLLTGDSSTLSVIRNPISATDKITWTSSNKKIATVNKNGKVKARAAGKATITATSASGKKVKCKVTVSNPLNATTINLQKGKTITTLSTTALLKDDPIVSVKSNKTKVLKATLDGETIVLEGLKTYSKYVTVTVKTASGVKGICKVKVVKSKVKTQSITVEKKKKILTVGTEYQLTVTRNPISATDKVTYKSSNKKVVTVDKNGNAVGMKKGKATINVTSASGKKATCKVTVN
ncbi:MAG: Ig-like domain-containing protein [Lachnotalea sp.]